MSEMMNAGPGCQNDECNDLYIMHLDNVFVSVYVITGTGTGGCLLRGLHALG